MIIIVLSDFLRKIESLLQFRHPFHQFKCIAIVFFPFCLCLICYINFPMSVSHVILKIQFLCRSYENIIDKMDDHRTVRCHFVVVDFASEITLI
jgi:hypothetical protein